MLFHHDHSLWNALKCYIQECSAYCYVFFFQNFIPRPWFGLVRRTNAIQQCNEGYGMSAKSLRGARPHNHRAKYIYPVLFRVYCPAFYCPKTKGVLRLYYYC